ncbi:MAG: adenosylmethionine--8-amino-7-oxononanoate transaminase [Planctomycetes bacterium]|nr:adenosylmethionine--8-amino-7-oxononanoate transaminase [Planctomycetota bacterium]
MVPDTPRSRSLRRRDRRVLWHPFTQQRGWEGEEFPIFESGGGCWLVDSDGHRYLDGISSLWCNIFGHRVPAIDRAIRRQLDRLAHSTFLGSSHEPGIALAEELLRIAPRGLRRVFYSDDGSTAMEIALKMAFQFWRQSPDAGAADRRARNSFLTLGEAYHGDTIGAVSAGGFDLFHAAYRPLLFRTWKVPPPLAYRTRGVSWPEGCRVAALRAMEEVLRKHGRGIAAVVIEPLIQGAAGMLTQPPGFVRGVRRLCDRYDTLLVCDEVATGFGRTGKMFACDHERVTPDLMTVAKGLTGGYLPLAATLTTERIYRAFLGGYEEKRTFYHGHTYTANPLACAAARATLAEFRRRGTLERLPALVGHLRRRLAGEIAPLRHVGEIRQCGLMVGIELVDDRKTGRPYPFKARMGHRVILVARTFGVFLRPLGDVIVLMPPLSISKKQIDLLVGVTAEAIEEATGD